MTGSPVRQDGHDLVLITGMSGAGRTTAAKVLEDIGYYVIDNLPPSLLSQVLELASRSGGTVDRVALVADLRARRLFGDGSPPAESSARRQPPARTGQQTGSAGLVEAVEELRTRHPALRVVFLEADDDTLLRRFEATRRRHPLGEEENTEGVAEGIGRERAMLTDVRGAADLVIDTSDTNVHELRDRLVDSLGLPPSATMRVNVVSFGYKHGLPRDADLVLDVRFLPNPHWVDHLRGKTGRDEEVRRYVLDEPETGPFLERLQALLDIVVPGSVREGKRYLTIAVGCTGGRHRSVTIGEEVAAHLRRSTQLPVHVDHRDVERE